MALDLENRGLIGRGAHGSVWLVYDRSQGRFLALKVVQCRSWDDAQARLDDLRSLVTGQPNPWHVAPLELGRGDGAPDGIARAFPTELTGPSLYVLMPHVHGPSAAELAQGDAAFGWAEALAVAAQVAQKLARRPEGRAHLDLKPENVLVDRHSGEVFLVDAHCGATAGTPAYAAPEQATNPTPAADLFSLGRLLRRLAARDVGPDIRAEILPSWPDIPASWPPERRRIAKDAADFADHALCQFDRARRPTGDEAATRLLELAAALNGPDPHKTLVTSMNRAHLERVDRETEQLAQANQDPLPQRGRGQGAGAPRPAAPRTLLLAAGLTAALVAFGLWPILSRRHRSALGTPPPPVAAAATPRQISPSLRERLDLPPTPTSTVTPSPREAGRGQG